MRLPRCPVLLSDWAAGWPRLHDLTHILNILIYFYVHVNVLIWLPGSCTDFYFFFHLIWFFSPALFVFVCHLFRIVPLLYVTWLRINDIYISSTEHIVLHVLTLLNITLNISMTSDVLEHFKCDSVKRCCSKCVKRCTFNLLPLLEWTSMAPYRVEVSRVPYGRQVSDCSTDGPRRGRPWTGPRQPGDEPLRDLEQASPWWSRCAVSQWLDNRCYVLSTETLSEKIGICGT